MAYAKTRLSVLDQTFTPNTAPVGVGAFAIQTQKGRIGEAVFLRSFEEYRREYGEVIDPTDSLGPAYAKRVFDNGGQLYVTRIVHFTDINDITSFTPIVASGNNGGIFAFSEKIIGVDEPNNLLIIRGDLTDYVDAGDTHVVQKVGGGTTNLTVAPAGATYAGGFTTIEYVAIAPGGAASGDTLTWSETLVASLNYTASSAGSWGNIVSVEIRRAASGLANSLDIFARSTDGTVLGTDLNEVYRNFPSSPSANDIALFNQTMKLMAIDTVITSPIGVVPPNTLSLGTDDYGSVTALDYVGSTTAGNGIRAFDSEIGFVRIACPEIADNIVDNALLDYVVLRKDCLAITRTPESLSAPAAITYRNAEGAYSAGTKIDDWRVIMLFGGIKVASPYAPDNGAEITMSPIADYFGLSSSKDANFGAWFSPSNTERGTLTNVNDIVYNIDTLNRQQEAEDLTNAGLFPVIKKKINGVQTVMFWGDTTLQVAASLFQFENVANVTIYISNGIKPITDGQLFNPNDILTWKTIYRSIAVFMQDLQNRRGISAWRYDGDQDVDFASQAVINTPATIAQGKYIFKLFYTPNTSLREVEVTAIATNQGVLVQLP